MSYSTALRMSLTLVSMLKNSVGDQPGPEVTTDGQPEPTRARPKPRPPSRKGMPRTTGSFVPGDPRINRAGRPRAGTAFSERGRERLDPDTVLDLAEKVLADESIPARERLAIVMPVVDRIYTRPESKHSVNVHATSGGERSFAHLTDDEVDAELARLDRLALPSSVPDSEVEQ